MESLIYCCVPLTYLFVKHEIFWIYLDPFCIITLIRFMVYRWRYDSTFAPELEVLTKMLDHSCNETLKEKLEVYIPGRY